MRDELKFQTSSKHSFKVDQRFFKEIESCYHLFRRVILLDQKRKGIQMRHLTTFSKSELDQKYFHALFGLWPENFMEFRYQIIFAISAV